LAEVPPVEVLSVPVAGSGVRMSAGPVGSAGV
jgi:hypothetical protein